jgi:hypothetical protein
MELDDVLSDKAPEKVEAPAVEKTEAPVERSESIREVHRRKELEAAGRDPATGKFIPKEPKEEAPKEKVEAPKVEAKPEVKPPQQEMSEKERAFLRAAEEERRKRQDLERELAQYRQKPPEKTEEKKTFWDDPEGHFKTVEQRIAQRELAMTLKVSEQLARSKYQDFDDKIGVFAESLKATPGLHAEWLASPDPAEFAYKHGARLKEMREVGDLDKYREKIEKETRAKLEAEFKAKQEELEKKRSELPGSLSDVRGTTTQQKPVYAGPTSLDDILGRKS